MDQSSGKVDNNDYSQECLMTVHESVDLFNESHPEDNSVRGDVSNLHRFKQP